MQALPSTDAAERRYLKELLSILYLPPSNTLVLFKQLMAEDRIKRIPVKRPKVRRGAGIHDVSKGWFGESERHRQAARGIKTVPIKEPKKTPTKIRELPRKSNNPSRTVLPRIDTRPKRGTHLRAKNWAFDVLDEMEPDEVDEETIVIAGREYLLTVEGWSDFCFLEGPGGLEGVTELDPKKDYDECREYAAKTSDEILREEWPRYWGKQGYKMIAGQFDAYTGEFGRVWALWVR